MTILGTGILWFGWFGFNAGSALGANGLAAFGVPRDEPRRSSRRIRLGPHGVVARIARRRRLGVASGAVAGLVAITPGGRLRRSDGRHRHRTRWRRRLLVGGRPEVPARLRRLARRRRRPPGRRHRRCAASRRLRDRRGQRVRSRRTARRWRIALCSASRLVAVGVDARVLVRRHSDHRQGRRRDDRPARDRGRRDRPVSTSRNTRRSATRCSEPGGIGDVMSAAHASAPAHATSACAVPQGGEA